MPVSKKPRTKAASRTPPRAAAVPALPDRRAMESYLATIAGRRCNDAIAKAQDVMYDAWERTASRSRVALARKALGISPLCADAYNLLAEEAGPRSRIGSSIGSHTAASGSATVRPRRGLRWEGDK